MYKVLICGGRTYDNYVRIREEISRLSKHFPERELLIIHGGAKGADSLAGEIAVSLGIHVAVVPALWNSYGRAAGPIRNNIMLSLEPDEVIGFHKNLDESRGTIDMLRRARKAGILVKAVR